MTVEAFARSCQDLARQLRALPGHVHAALEADGTRQVAAPVAAEIRDAYTGPWARVLATGTRARTDAGHPTIEVAGSTPVVSGGASVTDLVYGNEYGGGRSPRTRQFRTPRPAIIPTLRAAGERMADAWARIVQDAIERNTGG